MRIYQLNRTFDELRKWRTEQRLLPIGSRKSPYTGKQIPAINDRGLKRNMTAVVAESAVVCISITQLRDKLVLKTLGDSIIFSHSGIKFRSCMQQLIIFQLKQCNLILRKPRRHPIIIYA